MQIIENYADLLRKIDIIKAQIEMFEVDIHYWFGKGSIPFSSPGAEKHGMDAAARNTDRAVERLKYLESMLEFYSEIKEEIEHNVNSLEGLEYKIAKMRFIDNMTYKEIAKKLGYSHSHVRNLMSEKRQYKDRTHTSEKG
ncbi:hypothetical protein JMA_27230 [Jeotgalibacillus malaysiensis]|uniref:RNA polymerase sigma-70 region 4 domain-containing protein n=1 Tax=Jeotgalibacillus malaysiensis TaxID=1508404 RepID=A0A0B5AP42_9BACL|nr:sigma factor-like helix-turn-helix DNA-binding protein [Jeotgalibacillus malaysiensis]AJD92040.1 hypothetical protein JMA_27230 [Jeotgalibacillus malaysiensis]